MFLQSPVVVVWGVMKNLKMTKASGQRIRQNSHKLCFIPTGQAGQVSSWWYS
jgi:hypothetical protein